MPHHDGARLDDLRVGSTDAIGNILIQLIRNAATHIVGLETIEVISHWSRP